jgi:hypothetical protein
MTDAREVEIVECLTNEGDIPLADCFVYRSSIQYWNPHLQCLMHKVFRDESFALACIRYLQARGLTCDRQEDFAVLADRHQWEGWGLPPPRVFE